MLLDQAQFPAFRHAEQPDRVVRPAGGQPFALRVESQGHHGVNRAGENFGDFAFRRVHEGDFPVLAGVAAADGEPLPGGMPRECLDALRQVLHAAQQLAVRCVPNGDFVVAAGCELCAVRAERQRGDGHRSRVAGRRLGVRGARTQGGDVCARVGSIELCTLRDPLLDQRDLFLGQRVILLRHAVVGIAGDQQAEQLALGRLAGGDGGGLARAGLEQGLEVVKLVVALRLLWSVAGHAFAGQNGRDVSGEAHSARSGGSRRKARAQAARQQQSGEGAKWKCAVCHVAMDFAGTPLIRQVALPASGREWAAR